MAGKIFTAPGHVWKHGTYLADAGGLVSTGGKVAFWRSALGTIGIYIPFKKISLGTAGKFSPGPGHVWKHGTYLADAGGLVSTGGKVAFWRSDCARRSALSRRRND